MANKQFCNFIYGGRRVSKTGYANLYACYENEIERR